MEKYRHLRTPFLSADSFYRTTEREGERDREREREIEIDSHKNRMQTDSLGKRSIRE